MKQVLKKIEEWEDEVISIELEMIQNRKNLPEYLRLVTKRNEYLELIKTSKRIVRSYGVTEQD